MTLIKSISGIRGTIGGTVNNNLTPIDTVKFGAAYGMWLKQQNQKKDLTVIIGRDARISGDMISSLVSKTLLGLGIDVKDVGLSTTPTVEIAVPLEGADGGVIITASHNPKEWNALKLLNEKGEFLNGEEGDEILKIAKNEAFSFAEIDDLGSYFKVEGYINTHIEEVLKLELVDVKAIKEAGFKVVVDAVNSTGGIAIPALLKKLNVECIALYCEPNGYFPHNPEPLKEHLTDISELVVKEGAHLGVVVDPDVDRLAVVCDDGSMFGEEYTLVACADYVLGQLNGGDTVSNLSSSRALRDITNKHNGNYTTSAVGEVNVVNQMKNTKAVIGGEGNGGIIYPTSHYGRDSLVGVALFLSHLAHKKMSCKALRASYPNYFMSKNKIKLTPEIDVGNILKKIALKYQNEDVNTIDGVKIDFDSEWVHLRKSNTEPIIRVYTESTSQKNADDLGNRFIEDIKLLTNS
ncbi:phosphoglucosamine mutase [Algibacter mikhailovii]|uniref:Phosphoglucosamine mutase n=1 Tax=Algibacter mikhailovii TaxID=425498 RepID=A0A918R3Q9_9FLAO|nr:phosphoglucosamine mutase [Algibacter mikhailovii]GGZ86178.1 phosphoglucosamine mutase [Algibacter mikhailovii]